MLPHCFEGYTLFLWRVAQWDKWASTKLSLLIENSDCLWVDSPHGARVVCRGGKWGSLSLSFGQPHKRAEAIQLTNVTKPTTQDEFLSA